MKVLVGQMLFGALLAETGALPVYIQDRKLMVNGAPFHMKGVNWNPVPVGGYHPEGLDFHGNVQVDAKLMAQAGINVVRTYRSLVDGYVLDVLWSYGIQVLNGVYAGGDLSLSVALAQVNQIKDHPAILMWVVGNEWNYNLCYNAFSLNGCQDQLQNLAQEIKNVDRDHPVATVYGEVPPPEVVRQMSNIDVWGINYYDGQTFGDLFNRWSSLSSKPMFISEYGADAYNTNIGSEDQDSQALATRTLTQEIFDRSVVFDGGMCSGGLLFEWADEWWKDGSGSSFIQEVGGVAPGGGPFPDSVFNEEWWGITTINGQPRKAYYAYASMAIPMPKLAAALISAGGNGTEGFRKSCTASGCTYVRKAPSLVYCWGGASGKVEIRP